MDTPLAMQRGGSTNFYQQDALGSVSSLSDDGAAAAQRYEYGAFGQRLTVADTSRNPFLYTGREWDQQQGSYHYRARAYAAKVGRFLSEDPEFGPNSYPYATNAPLEFIDATGRTSNFAELDTTMLEENELRLWNQASHGKQLEAVRFYRFTESTGSRLRYIGRTKNLLRRSREHGKRIADDTLEEIGGWMVSRTQARALEQAFIRNAGRVPKLANRINAMAEKASNQELIRIAQILIG